VAHAGRPFIVHSGAMDVEVLGTEFNISAYRDESEFKTTLVEGRVKVDFNKEEAEEGVSKILEPNDQAVLNLADSELSIAEVNTDYYTSWRRGKIEFDNENLDAVIKRLGRWYDFEHEFENPEARDYHFTGRLDREEEISSILKMLEMTTEVRFEYRDGKIIVF
jgi:ferric-dicitrate binding protein FerR (iron transport regulator)